MILHIAQDDKFVDAFINIFEEAAEGQNTYVIWQPSLLKLPTLFQKIILNKSNRFYSSSPSKNISSKSGFTNKNSHKFQISNFGSVDFFNQIGDITKYKLIIFHSLVYNQAKLVNIIKSKFDIPIIWSPFGYEVYNMLSEFKKDLYLESTKKLIFRNQNIKQILQSGIDYFKAKVIRKAIKEIDYCAIAIDSEFEFYKSNLNDKLRRFWFSYYPIDQMISNKNLISEDQNILIGNSAFPSNNHIEAFQALSNTEIDNRKVICPLSYGDKILLKETLDFGHSLFGSQFYPLIDFMPIEEYYKLTATCNVVIMNQCRQQAFGNVLIALWNGSKVYLRSSNTIYSYLKNKGVYIFNIDEDTSQFRNDLSEQQIEFNRSFIRKEYSKSNIIAKTQEMISHFI